MNVIAKCDIFASIAAAVPGHKKLARSATSLAKSFKPTVAESLRRTSDLAYWLYVYERPDLALQACGLLNDLPFKNDYNLWTWVEATLALEWKLRTLAGEAARAQACAEAIRATYQLGNELERTTKARVLERRLKGNELYDERIQQAEQESDKPLEESLRLIQLKELLFLQALRSPSDADRSDLERQADVQLSTLRGN